VVHLLSLASGCSVCTLSKHLRASDELPRSPAEPFAALPPVSLLCLSPDSQWLAVAVTAQLHGPFRGAEGPNRVCVYSMETQRAHALLPLPRDGDAASPAEALCFTAAGDRLLLVSEAKEAHVLDLEAPARSWAATQLGAALSERQRELPGHVRGVSVDPALGLSAVLIHTPLALCLVDFARPLGTSAAQGQKRRRRDERASAPGNGRVILLEHPALFAAYFRAGTALLIEQTEEERLRLLPPPLIRSRFGAN
jgi:hypothetical protein